jgi:glycosyltransferase involved in cell wall biosynthesis
MDQTHRSLEIIIIDQTDHYPPALEDRLKHFLHIPHIHYEKQKEANVPMARNRGIELSTGEIIVLIDDDVCFDSNFIHNHIRNYADPAIHVVAGAVLNTSCAYTHSLSRDCFHPKHGWLNFPKNYDKKIPTSGIWTNNVSLRKETVSNGLRFDENFTTPAFREDSDFALQLWHNGVSVVFDPACWVIEKNAPRGGMRALKVPKHVKPLPFIRGECYFIFKNFGVDCWFFLLWKTYRRYVLFKYSLRHPFLLLKLNIRWFKSLIQAGALAFKIRKRHKGKYPTLVTPRYASNKMKR